MRQHISALGLLVKFHLHQEILVKGVLLASQIGHVSYELGLYVQWSCHDKSAGELELGGLYDAMERSAWLQSLIENRQQLRLFGLEEIVLVRG